MGRLTAREFIVVFVLVFLLFPMSSGSGASPLSRKEAVDPVVFVFVRFLLPSPCLTTYAATSFPVPRLRRTMCCHALVPSTHSRHSPELLKYVDGSCSVNVPRLDDIFRLDGLHLLRLCRGPVRQLLVAQVVSLEAYALCVVYFLVPSSSWTDCC